MIYRGLLNLTMQATCISWSVEGPDKLKAQSKFCWIESYDITPDTHALGLLVPCPQLETWSCSAENVPASQ